MVFALFSLALLNATTPSLVVSVSKRAGVPNALAMKRAQLIKQRLTAGGVESLTGPEDWSQCAAKVACLTEALAKRPDTERGALLVEVADVAGDTLVNLKLLPRNRAATPSTVNSFTADDAHLSAAVDDALPSVKQALLSLREEAPTAPSPTPAAQPTPAAASTVVVPVAAATKPVRVGAISLLGAGVVLAGVGVGLLFSATALARERDALCPPGTSCVVLAAYDKHASAVTSEGFGWSLIGAGAVATGIGLVWLLLAEPTKPTVHIEPIRGGFAAVLGGVFP